MHAVAGAVESGKSTLVAILTNGARGRPILDNGRGSARMAVFRHKHEIESGRTSSISQQMVGYDEDGRVLNYSGVAPLTPAEIATSARKVPSRPQCAYFMLALCFVASVLAIPYMLNINCARLCAAHIPAVLPDRGHSEIPEIQQWCLMRGRLCRCCASST